jgi:hypothetical protein
MRMMDLEIDFQNQRADRQKARLQGMAFNGQKRQNLRQGAVVTAAGRSARESNNYDLKASKNKRHRQMAD